MFASFIHATLISLLFIGEVDCGWREAIAEFISIKEQIPFVPRFDLFSTNDIESAADENIQNCDAVQLRKCLLHYDNLHALHNDTEDDDQKFELNCRILKYVRSCFVAAECTEIKSLRNIGLDREQAALIVNAIRIKHIQCEDFRFHANYQCIQSTFTEARKEFEECSGALEKLSWLKQSPNKACKAVRYYDACVERIVQARCGVAAGDSVCLMVQAITRELRFTDNCDLNCSNGQSNIVGFSQSILPDYQQLTAENCRNNECGNCDVDTFKKCSRAFKKELGIKGECVFEFIKELKEIIYKKGKKGFEAICKAGEHFEKCGDERICGCFNVDVLQKKLKKTAAEAWALNFTVFTLHYECTHKEFDDNFDCLLDTSVRKKEVLIKCEKRLREELKKPGHGIPCKAGQQYMECVSSPFKRACGLEAAKAVCNLELALLHQYGPHMRLCPFHCGQLLS